MASTLSWICYLSIQTHVTIFKKMYTLIKSPMKLWCKVTPKPSPETIKRETNFLHRFWPAKWLQNEYPKLYSLVWFWGLCPMVSHWGVFGRLGCRFEWHWVTTLRFLGAPWRVSGDLWRVLGVTSEVFRDSVRGLTGSVGSNVGSNIRSNVGSNADYKTSRGARRSLVLISLSTKILFHKVALGYLLHFVQNGSSRNILEHTCLDNNLKNQKITRPGFHLGAQQQ